MKILLRIEVLNTNVDYKAQVRFEVFSWIYKDFFIQAVPILLSQEYSIHMYPCIPVMNNDTDCIFV